MELFFSTNCGFDEKALHTLLSKDAWSCITILNCITCLVRFIVLSYVSKVGNFNFVVGILVVASLKMVSHLTNVLVIPHS